jgi:hypothetical protein
LWFTIKSCAHALIVRVHPPPPPLTQWSKQTDQQQQTKTNKQIKNPTEKSHPIGALSQTSYSNQWKKRTWTATIDWVAFFLHLIHTAVILLKHF